MSTLSILENYTPQDFGLTEYTSYRTHPETGAEVQLEVVEFAAYTDKRFAAAAAPVGIGKMLVAITLAKLTGLRTAIVVPFKGLQDQYAEKLGKHLVDIRGRSNYDCADYQHLDCRGGASMGCRYIQGKSCTYDVVKARARDAQVVVTNYDYWLNVNDHVGGLQHTREEAKWFGENPIEMLILDEGDVAGDKVADYLSLQLSENEIKRWMDPRIMKDDLQDWQSHIKNCGIIADLTEEIRTAGMELAFLGRKATKEQVAELHKQERLLGKIERIAGARDNWVCDAKIGTRFGRQWTFDIIWPGRETEQYLFCGIPKVVVMSGSLLPKDMAWMGVKKEDYEYKQWARIFPGNRQPIYICPPRKKNDKGQLAAVMVQRNMPEEAKRYWVEWIDRIIDGRLDRKGLIQTSSYEYQKYLMQHSRHADLMEGNTDDPDSDSAAEVAERFYKMSAPRILVSPSFARGWDFSFDRAEYTIISKVPFVPTQSKVMEARLERDEKYGDHVSMKKIEQGAGRVMRDVEDRGEVFLVDGHFTYFVKKCADKNLCQKWFGEACRTVIDIPKAPAKLEPRK